MNDPSCPSISVVVPAHRGGAELRLCLEGLRRASPPPLEILLVADGPDPEVRRLGEEAGVRVLAGRHRAGPAAARNLGAAAARGEVVLFVDSDVVVPPGAIATLGVLFRRHTDVAAVIGSYDAAPGSPELVSQYRNLLHHYVHQTAREEGSTFWGACGAIRRAAFEAVGGFDERRYRRPCIEDIELGYRLRRAGLRIRLCKELQVRHLKRWSPIGVLATDLLDRAVPWTELLLETGQWVDDLNLRLRDRLSVVVAAGLLLSAAGAVLQAVPVGLVAAHAAALAGLNRGLYGFLLRRRGPGFAAAAIGWHWLHLLCGGAGFAAGCARYLARGARRRLRPAEPAGGQAPAPDALPGPAAPPSLAPPEPVARQPL